MNMLHNRNKLGWWLVLVLVLVLWDCRAGLAQRMEFEGKETDVHYVLPIGSEGLLHLVQVPNREKKGNNRWYITQYDTLFGRVWEGQYDIGLEWFYSEHDQDAGAVYLLFRRMNSYAHLIYRLDLRDHSFLVYNVPPLMALDVTRFRVLGDDVYLGGMLNGRSVLTHYDLNTHRHKALASVFSPYSDMCEMQPDPQTGHMHVVMTHYRRRRSWVTVSTYGPGWRLIQDNRPSVPRDVNLIAARITPLEGNAYFTLGTYGVRTLEYPQGFFVGISQDDEQSALVYQKFTELHNFFNHLRPARRERIRRKIFRKRDRGKEYRVRYRFLLHDIYRTPEGYHLLVAEAYYPQFRSEMYGIAYTYGPNNQYRVFDGYRFTHAVMCLFDDQGKVIWDNSVTLPEMLSYQLRQTTSVHISQNTVHVLYVHRETAQAQVLINGVVGHEPHVYDEPIVAPTDEILQTQQLGLTPWYDNYFVTTGVQKVFDPHASGPQRVRQVFFINKLSGQVQIPPSEKAAQ